MTKFREKAREIREAGEAERGNFKPTGVPMRMYNYWLDNSVGKKAMEINRGTRRENFCHFWRVVLFWAPLRAGGMGIVKVLDNRVFQTLFILAAFATLIFVVTSEGGWLALLFGAGIMLAMAVGGFLLVLAGLGIHNLYRKYWNHDWDDKVGNLVLGLCLTAILALLGTVLVLGFVEWGIAFGGFLIGLAAVVLAGIYGFARLSDFIAGRRALRKAQDHEARIAHYAQHGEFPTGEVREPGRISKFFTGVGDLFIFVMQIVRVKKWKICPMVEIDK